jgi:hypothetical protein
MLLPQGRARAPRTAACRRPSSLPAAPQGQLPSWIAAGAAELLGRYRERQLVFEAFAVQPGRRVRDEAPPSFVQSSDFFAASSATINASNCSKFSCSFFHAFSAAGLATRFG